MSRPQNSHHIIARKGAFWLFFILLGNLSTVSAASLSGKPDSEALTALRTEARAFEHGEGVPKDPLRAASLYCDGARHGDADRNSALAGCMQMAEASRATMT